MRKDSTPVATDLDADTADSVHSVQLEVLILKIHVFIHGTSLKHNFMVQCETVAEQCLCVYVTITSV